MFEHPEDDQGHQSVEPFYHPDAFPGISNDCLWENMVELDRNNLARNSFRAGTGVGLYSPTCLEIGNNK